MKSLIKYLQTIQIKLIKKISSLLKFDNYVKLKYPSINQNKICNNIIHRQGTI
jgi:hypothetical protein